MTMEGVQTSLTTRDTRSIYNFSPFLSAPAVREVARKAGRITTINIPPTPCPSPLAPHITPEQLTNLKTHLTGPHTGNRGREIWESWKRAWDLWNNHYIEGRVNPEWVKKEWDRRAKEREDRGPRRRRFGAGTGLLTPRPEPQSYHTHKSIDPPETEPGTKWMKKENIKVEYETENKISRWEKVLVKKTTVPKTDVKDGQQDQMPRRVPIPKFVPETETEVKEVWVRKHPYYPVQHWSADVKSRQETGSAIEAVDGPRSIDVAPEPTELKKVAITITKEKLQQNTYTVKEPHRPAKLIGWDQLKDMRLNNTLPDPVEEDQIEYVDVKRTVWEPVGTYVDSTDYKWVKPPFSESEEESELEHEEEKVEIEVEKFENEKAVRIEPIWELVDDFDDPRPRLKMKEVKDKFASPSPDHHHNGDRPESPFQFTKPDDESDDDHVMVIDVDDDTDDEEDEWIPHTEEADGSSGGFIAMKGFKEYQQLPGEEWKDVLTNTVWRPRRVGEKTLKIDMDEDFDENLDDNELMVDGGVDCGKSPYPVSKGSNILKRGTNTAFRFFGGLTIMFVCRL
jgi:hypothetical protein